MKNPTNSSDLGDLHPGHHSIRLRGFDYRQPGFYFVTICSHEKKYLFGCIDNATISLTPLGWIVHECWVHIPLHFPRISLLECVVMPNHIHGIIEIGCQQGQSIAAPLRSVQSTPRVAAGSLGAILRSFKSVVTKRARLELKLSNEVWQRNYFEKVLRPRQELANARAYIRENPQNWQWDEDNPETRKR